MPDTTTEAPPSPSSPTRSTIYRFEKEFDQEVRFILSKKSNLSVENVTRQAPQTTGKGKGCDKQSHNQSLVTCSQPSTSGTQTPPHHDAKLPSVPESDAMDTVRKWSLWVVANQRNSPLATPLPLSPSLPLVAVYNSSTLLLPWLGREGGREREGGGVVRWLLLCF